MGMTNGVKDGRRPGQNNVEDTENTGEFLPLGTVSFYDRHAKERSPAVVSESHLPSHAF